MLSTPTPSTDRERSFFDAYLNKYRELQKVKDELAALKSKNAATEQENKETRFRLAEVEVQRMGRWRH